MWPYGRIFVLSFEISWFKLIILIVDQKGCIRGFEEFKYLGVKINKEDRQEN